eukprot:678006-Pelagomonas_calceolata.AAC.5
MPDKKVFVRSKDRIPKQGWYEGFLWSCKANRRKPWFIKEFQGAMCMCRAGMKVPAFGKQAGMSTGSQKPAMTSCILTYCDQPWLDWTGK